MARDAGIALARVHRRLESGWAAGTSSTSVKIALVSPYDTGHPGGVFEHIGHLRAEFVRAGHDVTVLAPRGRKGGLEIRDGFYGIGRTVPIPANGSTVRVTFDVTLYNAVKTLMRREQFDVIHLHEPLMPVLPYMVLLNSRSVNVATFHAFRASNPWYTAFKPYMSFMMSRLDARIAVSEPARNFVSEYFDGPYEIIPNGIDVAALPATSSRFPGRATASPASSSSAASTNRARASSICCAPCPTFISNSPRRDWSWSGGGKRDKFEGLMERYGVRNVDFVGLASPEALPRYYASCDLFCAPSISGESFGIVLLEAMASGTPGRGWRYPRLSQRHDERAGRAAGPPEGSTRPGAGHRPGAGRSQLRARMAVAGRTTASRYDWPKIAARVLAVYDRASQSAAAPRLTGVP